MSHACHRFWKCYKTLTLCSLLTRSTIPCACHTERHLKSKSGSETLVFFNILTSKCASRQNGVALFRHLNFQKWSEREVFLAFSLANVLRAITACTFSTSQLPQVVRTWCVLYMLTSKCASRHNGMHFFDISTSKSGPRMVCFVTFWLRNVLRPTAAFDFSSLIWPAGSEPAALASLLFDPPEPQIIGKTRCFTTFLPFRASASSFFWLFLFSDLLSSTLLFSLTFSISAFHLSILSESLTSKLPSIMVLTWSDLGSEVSGPQVQQPRFQTSSQEGGYTLV